MSNLCNNHPYTHAQENGNCSSKISASLITTWISHDLTVCYSLILSATSDYLRYYLKMSKCPSLWAWALEISCIVGPSLFTEAMLLACRPCQDTPKHTIVNMSLKKIRHSDTTMFRVLPVDIQYQLCPSSEANMAPTSNVFPVSLCVVSGSHLLWHVHLPREQAILEFAWHGWSRDITRWLHGLIWTDRKSVDCQWGRLMFRGDVGFTECINTSHRWNNQLVAFLMKRTLGPRISIGSATKHVPSTSSGLRCRGTGFFNNRFPIFPFKSADPSALPEGEAPGKDRLL